MRRKVKKKAVRKKAVKRKILKRKPKARKIKRPVRKTKKIKRVIKKRVAKKKRPVKPEIKKIAEKYPEAGPRDIRVVNIVVSTSLEHDIPLEKMAATLSNTEYNPEQFPGLVIRIKDPKTSALIFSSGKVVCTGARSMDKVQESIDRIIESLKKIGIKITITPKINIQNIVASGNIGMDLNLNVLAMKLDNTEYEPEQFPGLVYKLMEAKATFLLFSNGKVVCTGTKSETEVHAALDKLVETLKAVK
ncbi:TATA-box-binding protein [Candidatus Woesearchaeota archaeon]|nr:TATA-box-binding protein [Candidatus Woesearchaeota archaeon]